MTIDTSSVTASVGVVDIESDRVLSEAFLDVPLTHSQTVLPMANQVLSQAGLTFKDIDRIAVCYGPGSFTGVRIGVAAAKGLCFERNLDVAPVSTLEALAMNLQGLPLTATICAAMDARCRQVYTANFSCENGVITRLTPDEAMSLEDCKARLAALPHPVIFVGDGALLCEREFAKDIPSTAAPSHLRFVRARGTALAASRIMQEGGCVSGDQLQPLYLRLPQAERELKAKMALRK